VVVIVILTIVGAVQHKQTHDKRLKSLINCNGKIAEKLKLFLYD